MKSKVIRRILAILLSVALLAPILPVHALASENSGFIEAGADSSIVDNGEEGQNTEVDITPPVLDEVPESGNTTEEPEVPEEETTATDTAPDLPPLAEAVLVDFNRFLRSPFTLYVDTSAPDDTAARADLARYKTLRGAINHAQSGDTIMIVGRVPVTNASGILSNMDLTITSDGTGELVRDSSYNSYFISVANNASLTLRDIVFDGGAIWNGTNNVGLQAHHQMITCSGTLKLMDGTILRNNEGVAGGGLLAMHTPGYLEIDGAELYGGGDTEGGALYLIAGATGRFISGSIHDNYATGNAGGALTLWNHSKLTIEPGFKIYNNKVLGVSGVNTYGVGGAIYVQNSILEINGGEFYNNVATGRTGGGYGGAIGMNGGTITIIDGDIYNNTAGSWGGGVYYGGSIAGAGIFFDDSNFIMLGGEIRDNIAGTNGGGIYAFNQSTGRWFAHTNILGGIITGNTAGTIPGSGNGQVPSDAIYAGSEFNLSTDATINGTIYLPYALTTSIIPNVTVKLISASPTSTNNYLLATSSPQDVANGRVIVEPGTFSYNGATYTVSDTEPFVHLFSHTTHGIIEGSASSVAASATGSLVLADFVIKFNLNKPVGATSNPIPARINSITAQIFNVIMSLPGFPADPTLNGYIFEGWSLDQAGLNIIDNTSIVIGSNTLYAQWSVDPSNPGGNSGGSSGGSSGSTSATKPALYTVTYTDGVDGKSIFTDQKYEVEEGTVTPVFKGIPSRSGYEFDGWNPEVAPTVTGDAVYKATWRKIAGYYTVTYTDGIQNETVFADQTYVVEEGSDTPAFKGTISRKGYKFMGWDPEIAPTVTADVVYTATWKAIEKDTIPAAKPSNGANSKPKPGSGKKPSSGFNTGDQSSLFLAWAGLVMAGLGIMIKAKQRKRDEEC